MALLQPAPEVFDIFDDVLLLCDGSIPAARALGQPARYPTWQHLAYSDTAQSVSSLPALLHTPSKIMRTSDAAATPWALNRGGAFASTPGAPHLSQCTGRAALVCACACFTCQPRLHTVHGADSW